MAGMWGWGPIKKCKLLADHPHYRQTEEAERPIPAGMKAWPGGDKAPEDWDGGPVWWGNHEAQFYPELRTDPTMWHPADRRPHHMATIIAYTPKAAPQEAPIDWSGELEAVHEDGRVVRVRLSEREQPDYDGDYSLSEFLDTGEAARKYFKADGSLSYEIGGYGRPWRIRNVPQPTPQADTKPDLTVEEMAIRLARRIAGRDYGDPGTATIDITEARAIVALLPKPVHPDEEAVQSILASWNANELETTEDAIREAVKYGRALALAGEKEA